MRPGWGAASVDSDQIEYRLPPKVIRLGYCALPAAFAFIPEDVSPSTKVQTGLESLPL